MKVTKGLFVLLCFAAILFQSCQKKMICPAYQSTFIFDEDVRYNLFSRFENDSIPKPYNGVNKGTYGLIKPMAKKKRERLMATVEMRNILPPVETDSFTTSATDITPLKREMRE